MKAKKSQISPESQSQAMNIAKSTQKPGQTKEQTKLIAQGIEKGIAQYKKQQKEKKRQTEKHKKKERIQKEKQKTAALQNETTTQLTNGEQQRKNSSLVPWILLVLSWIGFIVFTLK